MEKRVVMLFGISLLLFAILQGRLMMLATNADYAAAASAQSVHELPLGSARGNIFDCNFQLLTNTQEARYALVSPGGESYRAAFESVPAEERALLYEGTQRLRPFLVPVTSYGTAGGQYSFPTTVRYAPLQTAPHLIGYIDSDGHGVSGIEYAFDSILQNASTQKSVLCVTNASGGVIDAAPPKLCEARGSGAGVMLTLDMRLQRVCEGVAAQCMDKGSIVVMDCRTGRVRASVSMPRFAPQNVAASLQDANAPFIDRAVSQFNLGSVFKPLLAAAALEKGFDASAIYHCTGAIDVNGHVYQCAYGKGHGDVDLRKALEISCNCYFVHLGLALGGDAVHDAASAAGFGEATQIAGTLFTARGNLPDKQTLQDKGQLSSLSFGQGELLATPAQVASFMNIFANGGKYISPSFVEGTVNEYLHSVTESLYAPVQRQVFSAPVADTVRDMLQNVVTNGLAKAAMPREGSAAGKTGTAQTGRMTQDGTAELMDAWFAGFFPAENPDYVVVVLLDEGTHQSDEACAIFAKVVDTINLCRNTPAQPQSEYAHSADES